MLELLLDWELKNQMKKKGANPDSNEVPKIHSITERHYLVCCTGKRRTNESSKSELPIKTEMKN
jgi:hypothetical protein